MCSLLKRRRNNSRSVDVNCNQCISRLAQPVSQRLNNKKQMACSDHKTVVEKMRERERFAILFMMYITSWAKCACFDTPQGK